MGTSLTRYEQETIVNFNEEEQAASIYTHNKALRRKLKQLSEKFPEDCRLKKVSRWEQAVDYVVPKAWIRINPPRHLNPEQRAAMAERMKANFSKKTSTIIGDSDRLDAAGYSSIPHDMEDG